MLQEHPPINHHTHTHTLCTSTGFGCVLPIHPHHLEIWLAIQTRCSDVTGPISATWGQKYQVTGEGLICFHFYYVSNLQEERHFDKKKKTSLILLDAYRFSSSQSLEEITLAKRGIRVFKIKIKSQDYLEDQLSACWEHQQPAPCHAGAPGSEPTQCQGSLPTQHHYYSVLCWILMKSETLH